MCLCAEKVRQDLLLRAGPRSAHSIGTLDGASRKCRWTTGQTLPDAALATCAGSEELLGERRAEPRAVLLGRPLTIDDEESVHLGRHERVDDVLGLARSQARTELLA